MLQQGSFLVHCAFVIVIVLGTATFKSTSNALEIAISSTASDVTTTSVETTESESIEIVDAPSSSASSATESYISTSINAGIVGNKTFDTTGNTNTSISASNGCTEITPFNFTDDKLIINNLAGLGPDNVPEEEMRFSKVGTTMDGREFDLVVKALDTQDKYTVKNPVLNIAHGVGFQIHFDVTANALHRIFETEFEISFVDQQDNPVEIALVNFYLMDIDHDARKTVHELGCYNLESLDLGKSQIPGFDTKTLRLKDEDAEPGFTEPQVLTFYNKTHHCDGSIASTLGSVTVLSNQVGFGCDYKFDLATKDFKLVTCASEGCFSVKQCKTRKKYFGLVDEDGQTCEVGSDGCDVEVGINPLARIVKTSYTGKSSFRISLGVGCIKSTGHVCKRTLDLRGEYIKCNSTITSAAPSLASMPTTTSTRMSECFNADTCQPGEVIDFDSDGLCGDAHTCPFDAENDVDSDSTCANMTTGIESITMCICTFLICMFAYLHVYICIFQCVMHAPMVATLPRNS